MRCLSPGLPGTGYARKTAFPSAESRRRPAPPRRPAARPFETPAFASARHGQIKSASAMDGCRSAMTGKHARDLRCRVSARSDFHSQSFCCKYKSPPHPLRQASACRKDAGGLPTRGTTLLSAGCLTPGRTRGHSLLIRLRGDLPRAPRRTLAAQKQTCLLLVSFSFAAKTPTLPHLRRSQWQYNLNSPASQPETPGEEAFPRICGGGAV